MANFFLDNKDIQYHLKHPLMRKITEIREDGYSEFGKYDYAPQNYEDAQDSFSRVLEIVGEICAETIAPNAEWVDQEGPRVENDRVIYAQGTAINHETLTKAGVYGISLPRKWGGLNFPIVPYVMSCELVSRADAGFGNIWGLQDCAETLHEFASDEINDEYLPMIQDGKTCAMDLTEPDAGSDLQAVMLKAHYDEEQGTWFLNGVKRFITNGDGDISLVLARSEEGTTDARGLSLFVYDKAHYAVKVRRIEHKMGIIGSPTCELVFTNAPAKLVGDRKMGLIRYVMGLMNSARLGIGAQSTGISEAAYNEAVKYAEERQQFGKAINNFIPVSEMLAVMQAKTLASRAILYETSRFVDLYKAYYHKSKATKLTGEERAEMKKYNRLADAYTPLLKLFSSEYCNQITYDAIQIHGGSGYMKDYPVERLARDARITNIYEGTSQLQVVAAIKGVTTGTFLSQIKGYETQEVSQDLQVAHDQLVALTAEYEEAVKYVTESENSSDQFLDLHARRLVEMGGHIILSYLMIIQASDAEIPCTDTYTKAAKVYVKEAYSKNKAAYAQIMNTTAEDIALYCK